MTLISQRCLIHQNAETRTLQCTAFRAQRRIIPSRRLHNAVGAASASQEAALVVVGSVNADMVLQVERLPQEGETLAAKTLQSFPGGKVCRLLSSTPLQRTACQCLSAADMCNFLQGANQAAAAGHLGHTTFFFGQVLETWSSCFGLHLGQTCSDCSHTQVGQDSNAEFLQQALTDAGVDLTHLRSVEGPSGTAVILLQPSGMPIWLYCSFHQSPTTSCLTCLSLSFVQPP